MRGTRAWPHTGLIPWFSKTEGNTYATLLHHPFLFGENQRSAQEVARRISGAVAGEVRASQDLTPNNEPFLAPFPRRSTQKSTYQVTITNPYFSHYIICLLPFVFLSPTSPLPFYSPSLSILPLFLYLPLCARLLFVCLCVSLLVCHDGSR